MNTKDTVKNGIKKVVAAAAVSYLAQIGKNLSYPREAKYAVESKERIVPVPAARLERGRNSTGRKKKSKKVSSKLNSSESRIAAPIAYSSVISGCGMSFGKPVKLVDVTYDGAVRLKGVDLSSYGYYPGFGSNVQAVFSLTGVAGSFINYIYFGLSALGSRAQSLASCYQWYVFRDLIIEFVPTVNVNQTGGFAFGLSLDPTRSVPTSVQGIMELCPSTLGPGWVSQRLRYTDPIGTRVYEVAVSSEGLLERFQIALIGLSTVASATPAQVGFLRFSYTLDLYGPGVAATSVNSNKKSPNSDVTFRPLDSEHEVVYIEEKTPKRSLSLNSKRL